MFLTRFFIRGNFSEKSPKFFKIFTKFEFFGEHLAIKRHQTVHLHGSRSHRWSKLKLLIFVQIIFVFRHDIFPHKQRLCIFRFLHSSFAWNHATVATKMCQSLLPICAPFAQHSDLRKIPSSPSPCLTLYHSCAIQVFAYTAYEEK